MANREDYRRRTVEYYHEGNTQAEVKEVLKVHPTTLREWERRMGNGSLKASYPKTRKPRKLPLDELAAYVEQNPDAFLAELGVHFNCSDVAVGKALKKLNITRNKRR